MKNKFGLLDSDLDEIQGVLQNQPKVEKAWIFGSRAKGSYKTGSDVDIALIGTDLDFETISQISYLLNEETNMPYKFDVVNVETLNEPALKDHIRRIGISFYEKQSKAY